MKDTSVAAPLEELPMCLTTLDLVRLLSWFWYDQSLYELSYHYIPSSGHGVLWTLPGLSPQKWFLSEPWHCPVTTILPRNHWLPDWLWSLPPAQFQPCCLAGCCGIGVLEWGPTPAVLSDRPGGQQALALPWHGCPHPLLVIGLISVWRHWDDFF